MKVIFIMYCIMLSTIASPISLSTVVLSIQVNEKSFDLKEGNLFKRGIFILPEAICCCFFVPCYSIIVCMHANFHCYNC